MDRRFFLKTTSLAAVSAISAMAGLPGRAAAADGTPAKVNGKDNKPSGGTEHRRLGTLDVSAIGLGCLPMQGDRRWNLPQFQPEALKHNMPLVHLVEEWAKRKGVTPAQFALVWMLSRKAWIVPIPGTTNPAHLDDFLGAAGVSLTPYEMEEFDAAYAKIDLMGHRADPFTESQIDK